MRPDLVALGGEHPGEQPLLLGHPPQRRVALGRRFEFVGEAACAPQRLVAKAGNERVEFDFQGQAGARRFSLARGQPAAAGREASERFAGAATRRRRRVRARRRAGRRRRRPVPSPRRAGRCRSRRARGRPAGRATAAAARRRPGPRSESWVGPAGPSDASRSPSPRSGRTARWIGAGPITARTSGRSAMRRCARTQQREPILGRDRALAGPRRRSRRGPPSRGRPRDRSLRRSGGPGSSLGSSLTPGAPVLKARAGAASSSSGTAISAAARAGRRSAESAMAATRERAPRRGALRRSRPC